MTGQPNAPARVWSIVLAGDAGNALLLLACVLLAAGCANPAVHWDAPLESPPSSMAARPGDRHVLAGEWEYIEDAVVRLTLDKRGNGHYEWKHGRFETHALIDHTWYGRWFQKDNDREGGFMVEFSPDFSEGEGRWWYSRIETDHAPMQKGGTFQLNKKQALRTRSHTPPAP